MAKLMVSGGNPKPSRPKVQGTVFPANPFQPDRDADILRKAMKGFGTDEKAIIDILAYRSNEQRQQIKLTYKTMFGRDLIKDLKSELGGKFEDVILGLMQTPAEYDASEIRKAISGLGTDEDALVEILCTRNNKQIQEIRATYKTLFKRDLEKDIRGDTSGHFEKLLVSMSAGGRMENMGVDPGRAAEDAKALYDAGEKRLGTDESRFNQILALQSFDQLRLVFQEYAKISRRTIEQSIKSEMSGYLEKGMLTIVKCVQDLPGYFAEKLYKSMKGAGTNDSTLIRVVVTRCEVDMVQVKMEFHRRYNQTLGKFIQDDCSGDYKRCLMALVRDG